MLIMGNFKEILKESGISGKDLSGMIGLSYGSFRSILSRGHKNGMPSWAKSFVIGFNLGVMKGEEKGGEKNDPSGK